MSRVTRVNQVSFHLYLYIDLKRHGLPVCAAFNILSLVSYLHASFAYLRLFSQLHVFFHISTSLFTFTRLFSYLQVLFSYLHVFFHIYMSLFTCNPCNPLIILHVSFYMYTCLFILTCLFCTFTLLFLHQHFFFHFHKSLFISI